MPILRERDIIKLLARRLPVGDDCAIIPYGKTHLVLTTDMLHRKSDFPFGVTAHAVGWRSAAASLSDIAAMGAKPIAVVVAIGAPRFEKAFIEELVEGIEDCCQQAGARYVGGDIDRHDELTIVTTALGKAKRPVLRSGAKVGHLVCVTGTLGRTAAALKLFKQRKSKKANALFKFMPRVAEGHVLAKFVSSMMDISDGVARSLYQLSEASQVGFRVAFKEIPICPEARELARHEKGILEMGLYTGEDFELLFTLPSNRLKQAEQACDFSVIGEVIQKGVWLEQNGLKRLEDRGFEH